MTHLPTTALRRALQAAAGLFLATAVLPAQVAAGHSLPGNWLQLTVTHGVTSSTGALLLCDPPLGHTHAAQACDELTTAGGDIRAIPARDVVCTFRYAPVTARAHGLWDGRLVEYTKTFSNACVMGAETGTVFALDE